MHTLMCTLLGLLNVFLAHIHLVIKLIMSVCDVGKHVQAHEEGD